MTMSKKEAQMLRDYRVALEAVREQRDKWKADAEAFHAAMLKARMERDDALQRVNFLEHALQDARLAKIAKGIWEREARERAEREAAENAVREV